MSVDIKQDGNLTATVTVDPDGKINFPIHPGGYYDPSAFGSPAWMDESQGIGSPTTGVGQPQASTGSALAAATPFVPAPITTQNPPPAMPAPTSTSTAPSPALLHKGTPDQEDFVAQARWLHQNQPASPWANYLADAADALRLATSMESSGRVAARTTERNGVVSAGLLQLPTTQMGDVRSWANRHLAPALRGMLVQEQSAADGARLLTDHDVGIGYAVALTGQMADAISQHLETPAPTTGTVKAIPSADPLTNARRQRWADYINRAAVPAGWRPTEYRAALALETYNKGSSIGYVGESMFNGTPSAAESVQQHATREANAMPAAGSAGLGVS